LSAFTDDVGLCISKQPLPTVKFLGGNTPYPLLYERPKKLILSELKNGPIFAVCGPKFTKFGIGV